MQAREFSWLSRESNRLSHVCVPFQITCLHVTLGYVQRLDVQLIEGRHCYTYSCYWKPSGRRVGFHLIRETILIAVGGYSGFDIQFPGLTIEILVEEVI